jgi:hypothetical protein
MTLHFLRRIFLETTILLLGLAAATGCRSYHVEITVENRTGAPVKLLEVDYPSASFGTDVVAPGASYHYRIQVLGHGPVNVQYTDHGGTQRKIGGPSLTDGDQGALQIVLLPDGKAEFSPQVAHRH